MPNHNELRYLDLCVTGINENGDIVQSIEQQAVCASVFMDKALHFNNKRRIFDQTGMCEASSDGFRDRGSIINANLMMQSGIYQTMSQQPSARSIAATLQFGYDQNTEGLHRDSSAET